MGIEHLGRDYIVFSPGPFDVHMHPRITDGITEDAFVEINGGIEGKAGLAAYTEAAIKSGFTGGGAMPNEIMRKYAPWLPEQTTTVPYPISNKRSVEAMQSAIQQHSLIPMAVYAGIDPEEIFTDGIRTCFNPDAAEKNFVEIKDEVMALKLWGDESTGGYNIPKMYIPLLAHLWHRHNPDKPVILHLEDDGVRTVLHDISLLKEGKDIPVHIAHVSSRQELQAVIEAKEKGMNVTCEATIHHLFLTDETRSQIGGYGCMKPTLKPKADIDFLWANLEHIDIIASDCAPHRRSDKEDDNPAFGVTNHTVMIPLMLGAVEQERLSMQDVYQKMCTMPRRRFNLSMEDGSETHISIRSYTNPHYLERTVMPRYGHNPFTLIKWQDLGAPMVGRIVRVKTGVSDTAETIRPSYSHIITPRTIGAIALNKEKR